MTPNKPSAEPVIRPIRSSAAGIEMLCPQPHDLAGQVSTISMLQQVVGGEVAFRAQCTPLEFSATLPPIEQAICELGSGA